MIKNKKTFTLSNKYIIIEIIPTTRFKNTGDIAQLCAIKVDNDVISNLNLRIDANKIQIPDILHMTNYDKEKFEYLNSTNEILSKFEKWSKDYELIIIPNEYTLDLYSYFKKNLKNFIF